MKIWDWMSGERLSEIPVGDVVKPFITVRVPKSRWGKTEDDTGEGEAGGKQRKRRGKKGKGKEMADVEQEEEGEEEDAVNIVAAREVDDVDKGAEDVPMNDVEGDGNVPVNTTNSGGDEETKSISEDTLVLVIHRVGSVDVPNQGQFLVFNAVGYVPLSDLCCGGDSPRLIGQLQCSIATSLPTSPAHLRLSSVFSWATLSLIFLSATTGESGHSSMERGLTPQVALQKVAT